MKTIKVLAGATLALGMVAGAAKADEVRIGLMYTLSGPPAALGEQARDGFLLAVEQLGGQLGGLDAEIIVVDDELKPDVAVTRARGLIERDDVHFVVGPIFSNVAQAIQRPIVEADRILISSNAGPSDLAGEQCHPNYFNTSYQNDQVHEVMGAVAEQRDYDRVFLMAPNYQAGRDSISGFKRHFTGEVVDEVYVPLGQLDFQGELARISAMQPDAVFTFMPGGMGINLVRQYSQAGLTDRVPFLSAFTVDETNLPAQQADALGMYSSATWTPDMDTPGNAEFVAAFEEAYEMVPAMYAMQAYDTAMLLDAAIASLDGDLSDLDAVREALRNADFSSLRGEFSFNTNQHPIQNFILAQVNEREDGLFQTEYVETVFEDYGDVYAELCSME
ncbi:MAG: branched-chain amino acid transport system substrate-binding protein [Saliniramus fredricksonii]|uniref:Amino acid/amide ABC transporter substrate-binding protein, HAAT family n=1 Tax=Saliniramus fredricksonii TaxID=1653334 RepID=A0A0P8BNA4_9HYPH|nr:ABC transporter substrate-binding protein [Saliniramus fredricksonii]KPQ11099.1 MAG: branched-chain amino acid transport system substrate-binding protein [Saliniramus fredricksonii]SCC78106.1 amino acid/amide ABC transporter substrate-binding protein, HAAT family [Saliniramus fredricksonii]